MRNSNRVLSILLLAATVNFGLLNLLSIAQANSPLPLLEQNVLLNKEEETEPPKNPNPGGSRAQINPQQQPLSWRNVFLNEEDEPPARSKNGGSRGNGQFCELSPGVFGIKEVWSEQPLFLWQGNVEKIEVLSADSTKLLWSRDIAEGQTSAVYTGKPLQAGQTYKWRVYTPRPTSSTFKFMETQKRVELEAELKKRTESLKTDEEIALHRAKFFAERQLWSDALKEAFSVEEPSPALKEMIAILPEKFCRASNRR